MKKLISETEVIPPGKHVAYTFEHLRFPVQLNINAAGVGLKEALFNQDGARRSGLC